LVLSGTVEILAWIPALIASLGAAIVPLALRALVGVGVGVVIYNGVGALLTSITASIGSGYGAMLPSAVQILDLMGFRSALSIIVSAFGVRLALIGVNQVTGSMSLTRFRPPVS
jgi:hypothetical protein